MIPIQPSRKIFLSFVFLLSLLYAGAQDFDKTVKDLTQKLSASLVKNGGNSRVAVADFVDLQGNTTELGKYLAEVFSVEFVNTNLQLVDRTRMDDLIKELHFARENITKPENVLRLGQMAGIQYLFTGTTTMLDQSIDVTIKAYDIEKGVIVAAQRGTLPRTEAINALFRSQVGQSGGRTSAVATLPKGAGSEIKDAVDDVNQVKATAMPKSICKGQNGYYHGYVCFENQMNTDLVLHRTSPNLTAVTLIAAGAKACSSLLPTSRFAATEPGSLEYRFYFKTTDPDKVLYGYFTMVVEGCVTKSVVLHPKNLLLGDKQTN